MILLSSPLPRFLCHQRSSIYRPVNLCRSIHLWNSTSADVRFLNKNIINYSDAKRHYPSPKDVTIELWAYGESKSEGKRITLAEYFESYAQPGTLLVPRKKYTPADRALQGENSEAEEIPCFGQKSIDSLYSEKYAPKPKKTFKGYTPPHEFHLLAPAERSYEIAMFKMWTHTKACHIVETHVRYIKDGKPDPQIFPRELAEHVHLRPDVILAAMPKEVGLLVEPQTNFAKSCWVMGQRKQKKMGQENGTYTTKFKSSQKKVMKLFQKKARRKVAEKKKALNDIDNLWDRMAAEAKGNGEDTNRSS